jgi:predicted metal-dependent hydrolase
VVQFSGSTIEMSVTITRKAQFKERVRRWAEKLDARVTSISVRAMTTKWASYSTTGRLTFDATLLELREELQDYVIAHELLHFHAPNHGKLWKSLMRVHLGQYEQLESELRRVARKQAGKEEIKKEKSKVVRHRKHNTLA